MTKKIKIIYFNAKGRAEVARLVLAQAGVDYEDVRIEREQWAEMKPKMPTGQLPAMEVDGELICQSNAIARFLAREFKLAGTDNLEMAKVDMIVDTVNDALDKAVQIVFAKDEATKKELAEKFTKETMPTYAKALENLLKKNGGEFFVGKDLTLADIAVAHTMSDHGFGRNMGDEWKKEAPTVVKHIDKILEMPKIKKWIETRPTTEM